MNWKVSGRERLWPEVRYSFRLLEVTKETSVEPQVIIAGIWSEIRTGHLPNTSVEYFCYSNLLGPLTTYDGTYVI